MRGRSSTVSRTRTRSVSFSARLALGLVINRGPTLESLPTEILLEIIRIAATLPAPHNSKNGSGTAHRLVDDDSNNNNSNLVFVKNLKTLRRLDHRTLRSLALTSRILSGLAHTILYAGVSLTSTKLATLYARTVIDCAHRDITLVSTTSPVSPTSPTCSAFSDIPALFAGKFTNRLSIEYPFHDYSPRAMKMRNTIAEVERFHAASSALLGIGKSAPSVQSPVLASLRTLIIDSCILEHHLKQQQHATLPSSSSSISGLPFPFVSPTPSELILQSYIAWTPSSSPSSYSPLAPLSAHLTHLIIATPPQKWTLPSTTLSALGDAPNLTHLALVRRANANEDNDEDFVLDVERILSERVGQLKSVVLVVVPDSGFSAWKDMQPPVAELSGGEAMEDEGEEQFDDSIHTLTAYLSRTHIWCRLCSLISQFTTTANSKISVSLVPGSSSAWTRALQLSSKEDAIFSSSIFHSVSEARENRLDRDLWRWARRFETWRRNRQSKEPLLV